MEHKIGTRITLEVVESDKGCMGCFFNDKSPAVCDLFFECRREDRADNKNIIYKEIKENEDKD
ncbi:MAG: hypothetical protein MJZ81_06395 [Bacteroidales bacterium]|nr:hypothetical protein [Bacteroidales bacterium]